SLRSTRSCTGAINSTQPEGATPEPLPRPLGTSTSWAAHGVPSETAQATRTPGARYRARLVNIRITISSDIAIQRRAHWRRQSQTQWTRQNNAVPNCLILLLFVQCAHSVQTATAESGWAGDV